MTGNITIMIAALLVRRAVYMSSSQETIFLHWLTTARCLIVSLMPDHGLFLAASFTPCTKATLHLYEFLNPSGWLPRNHCSGLLKILSNLKLCSADHQLQLYAKYTGRSVSDKAF